jgi:hypothetical protein
MMTKDRIHKVAEECMRIAEQTSDAPVAAELLKISFPLLQVADPWLQDEIPHLEDMLRQVKH